MDEDQAIPLSTDFDRSTSSTSQFTYSDRGLRRQVHGRHNIMASCSHKRACACCVVGSCVLLFACLFALTLQIGLIVTISAWGFSFDAAEWRASYILKPRTDKSDEYGLPTVVFTCATEEGQKIDYWPTHNTEISLCDQLRDVQENFKVFSPTLPSFFDNWGTYNFFLNRGHPIVEYLNYHFSHGPFQTSDPSKAEAIFLAVPPEAQHSIHHIPFAIAVHLFSLGNNGNYGNYYDVFQSLMIANAVTQHEFNQNPGLWQRADGADHFVVCEGPDFVHRSFGKRLVLLSNDGDIDRPHVPFSPVFDPNKDVANIVSLSFWLPTLAVQGFDPETHAKRTWLYFFAGKPTAGLRQTLLETHLRETPTEQQQQQQQQQQQHGVVVVGGHMSPEAYNEMQLQSIFCFHVKGSRGWSPRIVEIMFTGCIPVIVADEYVLPLSNILDWSKFSVSIHSRNLHKFPEILRSYLPQVPVLRENLRRVVPLFSFHKTPLFGDGLFMTALALREQIRNRAQNKHSPHSLTLPPETA